MSANARDILTPPPLITETPRSVVSRETYLVGLAIMSPIFFLTWLLVSWLMLPEIIKEKHISARGIGIATRECGMTVDDCGMWAL